MAILSFFPMPAPDRFVDEEQGNFNVSTKKEDEMRAGVYSIALDGIWPLFPSKTRLCSNME